MSIKKNGQTQLIYKGDYKPFNWYQGSHKIAGWSLSPKSEDALEWDNTYDDYIDGTINGQSTQANPYYREEENTSIVVTENQDAALEKCEINGVSVLEADYNLSEGLSALQNDYVGKDGVSSQVVTVQGKNLIDINKSILGGITHTDGTEIVVSNRYRSPFISVTSSSAYKLSRVWVTSNSSLGYFYYDINKVFISGSLGYAGVNVATITTPENCSYIRITYHIDDTNIQLELGSTATPYEPYQGVTIPYVTSQLYSLSSAIFDKVNVLRGKEVHNIGAKVFNGTEIFGLNSPHNLYTSPDYPSPTSQVLCTHYTNGESSINVAQSRIYFMPQAAFNSVAEWKSYLAAEYAKGTPVTVIYQLATPTEVAQTPQVVPLYSPLTNIFTDKGKVKIGYKLKDSTVKVGTDIIAPHPDYKSDILSASGNMVSRGRNYFNIDNLPRPNASITVMKEDFNLIFTSLVAISERFTPLYIDLDYAKMLGKTFTFKCNWVSSKASMGRVYFTWQNSSYGFVGANIADTMISGTPLTFTIPTVPPDTATKLVLMLYVCAGGIIDVGDSIIYSNIQLEEGSIANPFLPYSGNPTQIVLPTLRAIKLAAGATGHNYIDSLGNKWCADTLTYVGGGVWENVQRVNRYQFTGLESPEIHTLLAGSVRYRIILSITRTLETPITLSHYSYNAVPGTQLTILNQANFNNNVGYGNYLYIVSDAVNAEVFKAFLAAEYARGTPVTVDYILEIPIVTQLTLGELKTFPHYTAVEQDGSTKTFMNLSAKVQDYTI